MAPSGTLPRRFEGKSIRSQDTLAPDLPRNPCSSTCGLAKGVPVVAGNDLGVAFDRRTSCEVRRSGAVFARRVGAVTGDHRGVAVDVGISVEARSSSLAVRADRGRTIAVPG